jgi:hypothetical protein
MTKQEPEYVSVAEAAALLETSTVTIARLLRDGILPWEPNLLDRRGKLIKRVDVLALVAKRPAKMPPRKGMDAA